MAEQSLKDKTVKGVFWSAADTFLGNGVTFFVGIVLARLLSPDEYGLIGLVLIFTVVLTSVVDAGFTQALVRKKDTTDDDYNTMFITNMVSSLLMFALLFVCAPYIAAFFSRPELTSIARVMGLILIFQALSITQTTILIKRIDFKTRTKASVVSSIISGAVGISMAYMGYGVWALVGQKLAVTLIYTLCMWALIRWWPKFTFSMQSFHYMWGFGWKLMVSRILNTTWDQLYQVVVGKFYSPATLGQYSKSQEFASIFSSHFSSIIQRVTYPALAEVQNETERMVAAYRRVIKETMFVTSIMMMGLAAVAEPFIYCLIGPQWDMAASFLPFLCISWSFYPLHAINLNMLQVQGRSDIFLYLEIVKKIIGLGPLFLGIFVGIYWMIFSSIITGFISFLLNSYYTGKRLNYTSWMQLRDIAPSFKLALVIAVAIFFLKYLSISYWIILPLQIIIGAGLFFLICERVKMQEYIELKIIAEKAIVKFKILYNNK